MPITEDFFRSRLDQMIDLRRPLAVLASRMPWQEIEASLAHRFAREVKAGKKIDDVDLFGATSVLSGAGVSNAGRPRLPLRLMISLLYLKHAFDESDEALVQRWSETPTWQYFSGMDYFENRLPCDPTLLVKFRRLLGEEGVEELLARTLEAAVALKLIAKKELSQIIVDSTVQEKAIAHPTDSKLLETARAKLVQAAKEEGIELKQTFAKEGHLLGYKAGRYAHAPVQAHAQSHQTPTHHCGPLAAWSRPQDECLGSGSARDPGPHAEPGPAPDLANGQQEEPRQARQTLQLARTRS